MNNKYNIFDSNHLFTRSLSVRLIKTGPLGAATPPNVGVMAGTRLFTRVLFTPIKVIFQTWKGYPLYPSTDRQLK